MHFILIWKFWIVILEHKPILPDILSVSDGNTQRSISRISFSDTSGSDRVLGVRAISAQLVSSRARSTCLYRALDWRAALCGRMCLLPSALSTKISRNLLEALANRYLDVYSWCPPTSIMTSARGSGLLRTPRRSSRGENWPCVPLFGSKWASLAVIILLLNQENIPRAAI